MAASLERHLALTDTSPGEYQGILYDFADKVSMCFIENSIFTTTNNKIMT